MGRIEKLTRSEFSELLAVQVLQHAFLQPVLTSFEQSGTQLRDLHEKMRN